MIIAEEQGKTETDVAGETPNRPTDARGDQPPPYSPGANSAAPATSAPNLPATNYVHVNRQYAPVRGQYLIDLRVPPLPADAGAPAGPSNMQKPGHKPNLLLEALQASIGPEVWVVDSREEGRTRRDRARLRFRSSYGRCSAAVREDAASLSPRPFLNVVVKADHNSAQLTLPRSFHGKLMLYTVYGRITLSEGLQKVTAVLWEADGTQMCFVGDRPAQWKNTLTNDGEEVYKESEMGEGEDVDEAWVGAQYGAVSVRFEGERAPLSVLGSICKLLLHLLFISTGSFGSSHQLLSMGLYRAILAAHMGGLRPGLPTNRSHRTTFGPRKMRIVERQSRSVEAADCFCRTRLPQHSRLLRRRHTIPTTQHARSTRAQIGRKALKGRFKAFVTPKPTAMWSGALPHRPSSFLQQQYLVCVHHYLQRDRPSRRNIANAAPLDTGRTGSGVASVSSAYCISRGHRVIGASALAGSI